MTPAGLPSPLVTAVIVPGKITGRVKHVRMTRAGKAAAAAREQPAAPATRRRKPAAERRELRAPGLPSGWQQLCVSVPREVVEAIDAVITAVAAAGGRKLSRSRLIRIALAGVDLEAVIAAVKCGQGPRARTRSKTGQDIDFATDGRGSEPVSTHGNPR